MNSKYVYRIRCINKKAVHEAKKRIPNNEIILKITNSFKVLGDVTRVRMLYTLSKKELCVCDLSVLLGMTQSAVSHQLRILRNFNMVKFRKEGKIVYYSLADTHVAELIDRGIKHAIRVEWKIMTKKHLSGSRRGF